MAYRARHVKKLNESWSLFYVEGIGIVPVLHDPYWVCPRHAETLVLHEFHAYRDSRGFCHLDVNCKCPLCDWYTVFGISIDCKEVDMIRRSRWHGKVLRGEAVEYMMIASEAGVRYGKESIKKVEERLRSMGYW